MDFILCDQVKWVSIKSDNMNLDKKSVDPLGDSENPIRLIHFKKIMVSDISRRHT